jgi:hypothetical protein
MIERAAAHNHATARDLEGFLALAQACDLALARARDFDLDLAQALDRARARERDLALALARARDRDLDPAHTRLAQLRDLAFTRARTLALDLARTLDLDLALDLDTGLHRAFARAHDLALDLASDLALNLDTELTLALVRIHAHSRRLARALEDASGRIYQILVLLGEANDAAAVNGEKMTGEVVNNSSLRLVTWAVRMLPAGERGRYEQEFQAELFELRMEPRRRQFAYAMRVSIRTIWLRRELRRPIPERMR